MRLLLDTHILLWWLMEEGSLSAEQVEVLERAEESGERLAIAATARVHGLRLATADDRIRRSGVVTVI